MKTDLKKHFGCKTQFTRKVEYIFTTGDEKTIEIKTLIEALKGEKTTDKEINNYSVTFDLITNTYEGISDEQILKEKVEDLIAALIFRAAKRNYVICLNDKEILKFEKSNNSFAYTEELSSLHIFKSKPNRLEDSAIKILTYSALIEAEKIQADSNNEAPSITNLSTFLVGVDNDAFKLELFKDMTLENYSKMEALKLFKKIPVNSMAKAAYFWLTHEDSQNSYYETSYGLLVVDMSD